MSANDMEGDMTLEQFQMWDILALKAFLAKKGLPRNGNKNTLVARAFCAWEQKVPDSLSEAEVKKVNAQDYQNLLNPKDCVCKLPDPFTIQDDGCWLDETAGMEKWPPIYMTDISEYLRENEHDIETASLRKRLLNDYKDQKAYSFFSSQWLCEVFYHPIKDNAVYCFLMAKCTPSQKINDTPYRCWVATKKSSGEIGSSYCTCYAGLGKTCVHVCALMLKVDFCWRYGYVNKSVTSKECVWKSSSGKSSVVAPMRIREMLWKQPSASAPVSRKQLYSARKQSFRPTAQTSQKSMSLEEFISQLRITAPGAVLHYERTDTRITDLGEFNTVIKLPKTPLQIAANVDSKDALLAESVIPLTAQNVTDIENSTRGQACNDEWFVQRNGRITASNFHDVFTRVNTFKGNPDTDMSAILSKMCDYGKNLNEIILALKHGRNMEPEAIEAYMQHHKRYCSSKVLGSSCGLFVDMSHPYIAASPDYLVTCPTCGNGLLEVKCPLSVAHECPAHTNLPYLKLSPSSGTTALNLGCLCCVNSTDVTLSKNHKYFSQIIGQLALTGRDWCDFWVYTRHGHHLERIYVDSELWSKIQSNLKFLFENFMASRLFDLKHKLSDKSTDCSAVPVPVPTQTDTPNDMDTTKLSCTSNTSRTVVSKTRKGLKRRAPVYVCSCCSAEILEEHEIETETDSSIGCDVCQKWYHWTCVNITSDCIKADKWLCPHCREL